MLYTFPEGKNIVHTVSYFSNTGSELIGTTVFFTAMLKEAQFSIGFCRAKGLPIFPQFLSTPCRPSCKPALDPTFPITTNRTSILSVRFYCLSGQNILCIGTAMFEELFDRPEMCENETHNLSRSPVTYTIRSKIVAYRMHVTNTTGKLDYHNGICLLNISVY